MELSEFIAVTVILESGQHSIQFINKQHIQRIYEQDELIIIELIDYTTLKVIEQNIRVFMERFVK
tara:strand:+ start:1502 stop:1696 length:195 start_codon:yes stop_codon:yes gene_type:complete